jgi:putative SOS response-associated peptidase YedK
MCGRFTITLTIGLPERFNVRSPGLPLAPRSNIAPSQPVPVVIRPDGGEPDLVEMVWGLIPHWVRDPASAHPVINARAETLEDRPSFRHPLLYNRCLVPANGFYEWKRSGKVREPYYIHRIDDDLVAIAGLYDVWDTPAGDKLRTFAIITTEPNPLVSRYHDRMPAILKRELEERWLEPGPLTTDAVKEILTPYPADLLEAYRVSRLVNDPAREGSDLIQRLPDSTLGV